MYINFLFPNNMFVNASMVLFQFDRFILSFR